MKNKLISQTAEVFNSIEKWNTFNELVNIRNDIEYNYFKKAKEPILNYYYNKPSEKWFCEPWGDKNIDLKWYLKDFGINSLSIAIGWRFELHLRLDDLETFDTEKISELLKTSKYGKILTAFDRIDRQFEPNMKAMEYRNYNFGSVNDGNLFPTELSWYIANRTDDFLSQLTTKIDRFISNEEITDLIYEINNLAKNNASTQQKI